MVIGRVRYAQAADSGAHAPGTGTMTRYLAVGSGVDSVSYCRGAGKGPHTIGRWAAAFGEGGPAALIFEQSGGPPTLSEAQQAALRAPVKGLPARSGIELANWNWKGVRRFV